ncbi:hypothetical protein [Dolichospermum circinale]|uniref:hypothetical protein n=1 Tax=Dolichospermum circinale TaxID=109265 RepID=UPI00232D77F3|nr:hypothetical protein [Dolichospermum circinale]MDB9452554.1 hypothetical protein [Dolichospermum circinale CS-547]
MDRRDYFSDGTRGFDEWLFKFKVQNKKNYDAGSFKYIDYAGGIINEVSDSGQNAGILEIQDAIKKANIILVLLDGTRLIELLLRPEDKPEYSNIALTNWINKDIPSILGKIIGTETNIPVHFVITKWDCFMEKEITDLRYIVRNLLDKAPDIKRLLDNLSERHLIRFIPVSSLGEGFAATEYDDNGKFLSMTKTGNHLQIQPLRAEVPLAYALYDSLIGKYNKQQQEIEQMKLIDKVIRFGLDFFGDAVDYLPLPYNILGKTGIKIIQKSMENMDRLTPFEINTKTVTNDKQAMQNVINSCIKTIKLFEQQFPDSRYIPN